MLKINAKLKRLIVPICVVLGMVLFGTVMYLFIMQIRAAKKPGHLGQLLVLKQELLATADKEGKFPKDLGTAAIITHSQLTGHEISSLEYCASGKTYNSVEENSGQSLVLVFYEKHPRDYGFESGVFLIFNHGFVFKKVPIGREFYLDSSGISDEENLVRIAPAQEASHGEESKH